MPSPRHNILSHLKCELQAINFAVFSTFLVYTVNIRRVNEYHAGVRRFLLDLTFSPA